MIVLIHGNGGTLQGWIDSGVLPNLVRNYRVVALDARGHGKSGKPHDVKAYGLEMGLDVLRLLGVATRRHFDIIAESLRDDIRIIAEGVIALDAKVETIRASG